MKQILFLSLIFLASCKPCDNSTPVQSSIPDTVTSSAPPSLHRKWNAYETNLPKGIVVGGEAVEENSPQNWLSIERLDGTSVVVKNVDPSLWSAIGKGDTIQ